MTSEYYLLNVLFIIHKKGQTLWHEKWAYTVFSHLVNSTFSHSCVSRTANVSVSTAWLKTIVLSRGSQGDGGGACGNGRELGYLCVCAETDASVAPCIVNTNDWREVYSLSDKLNKNLLLYLSRNWKLRSTTEPAICWETRETNKPLLLHIVRLPYACYRISLYLRFHWPLILEGRFCRNRDLKTHCQLESLMEKYQG